MTDIRASGTMGGSRRWPWIVAFWSAAVVGLAALVYVIVALTSKLPAGPGDLKSLAHGDMAKLVVDNPTLPPPTLPFLDANDRETTLAPKLKAPVVIVNLWATWCAPCVREMPTLAKLQTDYPGRVLVIPISMDDPKDRAKARVFIAKYPPLPFYQEPGAMIALTLTPPTDGLPTTLIFDASGRERARLAGGADWSGADAQAVIQALLPQK